MVSYVLEDECREIFDPAVGAGAFFLAATKIAGGNGKRIRLSGTEIDPRALEEAKKNGLTSRDLSRVRITDFVLSPPEAIIAPLLPIRPTLGTTAFRTLTK